MINLSTLKHHAVLFLLLYLCLSVLISLTLGSFDSVAEVNCEYQDANLIWRNTPRYSVHDIKAMEWFKEKSSLIATWVDGKGFVEYPPYVGRLMQIGETGIKIRTANRSNSGTYWLYLTFASVDHKLEASTHLDIKDQDSKSMKTTKVGLDLALDYCVDHERKWFLEDSIVTPSNHCKPRLTPDGSFLKADLPAGMCGTDLTPRWKHSNKTVIQKIQNSSSVLDLGRNPEPGEYVVCAEGESATCYKGNISDLCTKYIIWRPGQSDDGQTSVMLPSVLVPVLILTLVAVLIWFKRGVIRKHCPGRKEDTVKENENMSPKEENTFNDFEMSTVEVARTKSSKEVQPKTKSGKVLLEIQNHLKKMYESLTNITLSPFDVEKAVSVSELYINIHFGKVDFADVDNWETSSSSSMPCDRQPMISKENSKQSNKFCPIIIFGDCGSGKSTWCKHLVNCWLQKSDDKDANIQGLNLPDIGSIQILLYLPLQFSDNSLSFQELLQKYLFKEKSTYIEFLMNYVENDAQNVLIIIDGMNIKSENSKQISELLRHKLVSSCTVIVTSRPSSFKLLYDTCHDTTEQLLFFRIREMDIDDSKIYTRRLLGNINRLHGKNLVFDNFWDFTEHLQVQSLFKVPYMCLLIMHVWMKNKNNFIEVTDILFDVINHYLRHALTDHQRKEVIDKTFGRKYIEVNKCITKLNKWPLLIQYSELLHVLSRAAAAMFTSEMDKNNREMKLSKVFSITDEDRLDLEAVCETGLLTESLSLSANKNLSNLLFSDRIICEFFISVFIALQEGKECDFIVFSGSSCLQNSMIIHMLFQLSNTVTKYIMAKASKNLKTENIDASSANGSRDSNKRCTYSITEKKNVLSNKPVLWLQWLMHKDELHENKLLFLTTALHFIDSLISLVLEDEGNSAKLVFWLPFITTLETLRLNINSCTLLLCKEWYARTQSTLKEVMIHSVHINMGTLELLITSLSACANLERLEISPAVPGNDNTEIFPETADLAHFSWLGLSERIKENKKLKSLKLSNLSLVGEVDILVSRLNHHANLETLELKNLSNAVQQKSSFMHSPGFSRVNDNDYKLPDKINLKELALERLVLLHSPINFMFRKTKKSETKICQNNLKVLRMSAVDMPPQSWEQLGSQIGLLKLSDVHLHNVSPRGSAQIILDGIGTCEELEHLSFIKVDTGESAPYFTFLKNLKGLSTLHLELMQFAGSSSWPLFEGIRECKKLKKLSFIKTTMGVIPEKVSFDLQNLSELTVDEIRITEEPESLHWLLDGFISCKNLKTLSLKNVKKTDIPPELSNRKTLKIDTE